MLQLPQLNRGVLERVGLAGRADVLNLYAARAARGFGDGFAAIILPAYLLEIGFNPFQIGVVATAALLGSAVTTLAVGLLAPRYHLRTLLIACAGLMVVTGLAFPSLQYLVFIAVVAFIGTINPTTGDIGVHVPLEQAALAHRASDAERTHIFARYSLIGALSIAAGALAAGAPDLFVSFGMGRTRALQTMFYLYAALGLIGALFYSRLPRAEATEETPRATALGPSRRRVYQLAALFSLDAFAGGFTVQSLMALWLFERFDLSLAAASAFFFWSNVLTAFSYPVAARLGKRFGLVNTMVFTHIPSSICLIVAAFSPSLTVAMALLLVRSALSQMDVPTRTSYVMAVVTPAERTAAASVTAVPRSLASAISPAMSGALLSTSFLGLPLILCGVLKIVYDLSLLFSFRHIKPPEEKEAS
ncbi:MAG TPA: MFS transporter [Xanthobacteraceae bacterium]|nr:MFS transporter [Xanthobacteraceae bacterium]